ncbi:MAG: DEAD/DEAH box helicase [Lentisphaeria bacterium]|nr:DEAD/DEAH box helicase [Lentisphaeria bacterium]
MTPRPLPYEYPDTPPVWLEHWPTGEAIKRLFSEGIRHMSARVIGQGRPSRIRWSARALTMEVGRKNPHWRLINGEWQIGCSCGYPGGKCPHSYAAAVVFNQIIQHEAWREDAKPIGPERPNMDTFQRPRPRDPGGAHRPRLSQGDLFDYAATEKTGPAPDRQLHVEVEFNVSPSRTGIRFYLFQDNRRKLLTLQQLHNFAYMARYGRQEKDGWNDQDRAFLTWFHGQHSSRQSPRGGLNMLRIPERQFNQWRERWKDHPERLIERHSQTAIRPGGGDAEVTIELTHVNDGTEIALIVTTAGGTRLRFHELAKQFLANNGQLLLDGQPFTAEFPVSPKLLTDVFSKRSPVVPRDKIPAHLPPLIQNRLDLVRGEAVERREETYPLKLHARCEGGDLLFSGSLNGVRASLITGETTGAIRLAGQRFVITTGKADTITAVRNFLQQLDARPRENGDYILPGKLHNMRTFVTLWTHLPDTVIRGISPELDNLFSDGESICPVLNGVDAGPFIDLNVVYVDSKGNHALTAAEIADARRRRTDIIRTRDGGWLRLDLDSLDQTADELAQFGFDSDGRTRLFSPDARSLFQKAEQKPEWMLAPDTRDLARRVAATPFTPPAPLTAPMAKILRGYQKEGFNFLSDRTAHQVGAILADDMGLGKTVQVLAVLDAFHARHGNLTPVSPITRPESRVTSHDSRLTSHDSRLTSHDSRVTSHDSRLTSPDSRVTSPDSRLTSHDSRLPRTAGALIICPASVVGVWSAEIEKFTPRLRAAIYSGSPARRKKLLAEKTDTWDILVTNYSLLRNDIDEFTGREFTFIVLDEAQQIKNPDALVTQAVKQLKTPRPLALTGTPIENRLTDLWSIMDFLNPGFLGRVDEFNLTHESVDARRALSRRIAPVVLRRSKELVAPELPPKTEELITVEMPPGQRALYKRELLRARQTADGGAMALFAALTRLRQICCDPRLIDTGFDEAIGTAKLDTLMEMIREILDEGHSVLVFSQFTSMLSLIENRLREVCFPYRKITGATPTDKRPDIVREFNEEPQAEVFLLSLKAAGTGLTLTKADYVFLFDPWWNPAVENQAIDRTHRIGQDKPVFAYRLIIKDSVEEKVMALQREKAELFAQIMTDSEASGVPKGLTSADLQKLLQ